MSKQNPNEIEEHFIYGITFEDLKKLRMQEVLEKLYVQKKYQDKIQIAKFLKEKFYPTAVRPLFVLKKETLDIFITTVFLLFIILMIANMVNPIFGAIPNQVDSLKTNKKFSSEKESKKVKKTTKSSKTQKQMKQKEEKERDSDRSFFSFLKKSLNNWWENKPVQRERVALFPIPLMPRGGYQLLSYEQMNMDPIFLMIHLYKLENLLILQLDKSSQLSKELNISQKNLLKASKKLDKFKLLKNTKRKNPILVLEKGFERFSGVLGFGIALRILTLTPLNPLDSLNIFETNDGLVRNYQDFVTQSPVSKEGTNQIQIQVGDKILVFPKKVTKELTELTSSTSSLEVQNSRKNVNKITPSVISKRQKLKMTRTRKKAKLRRLSDLPKIRQKSTTEEIFSVSEVPETNRPSIRIRIE